MTGTKSFKRPGILFSLVPIITMALFLGIGYGIFRIRAEILLVLSATVAGVMAFFLGYKWKDLEQGIVAQISRGMPAMLIVICVGLLIGSWIASGTIPMLVFYGLKIISPGYFLVTACLVCSVVSLVTGTSWGTAGTIGVAFMGIAQGLGIPLGPAAGAIVSGAYFGDKISPFSDTTNLAPIAAKSNLFDHIRHLLWTTTPAWVVGLLVYFFVGLKFQQNQLPQENLNRITNAIQANFRFDILLLLPPLIVLFFAIKKLPTIPGMVGASLIASILALVIQKAPFVEVMSAMTHGYSAQTGIKDLDLLFSRGGMMSMMGVTLIAFCAFAFAGIMQKSGMLNVILEHMLTFIKSRGSLILSTSMSGIIIALITGSSFLTILIPGELFAPAYRKINLAAKNLSRTTEDSGTVIVPLIPWSMAGVYMAGTLGVSTLEYVPWSFMCYLGVVFAIVYGFTGFKIAPKIRDDETSPGS